MKARLAELLVCPIDRKALRLVPFLERAVELSDSDAARATRLGVPRAGLLREIEEGLLVNDRLGVAYPILAGVPRMLVFENGALATFRERHAARLRAEHADLRFPNLPSAEGERDVLRSFSAEWTNYDWTGDSYWNLAPDAWFRAMRVVLDVEGHPLGGKRVLEVGIGIGATADHLARTEEVEFVGVDLGFAVDAAYRHFGTNPFLHVVQASAFAPPFAEESFDFVYSFGVLHHTYSTKAAFDQVCRLPRRGARLYVWVYSPLDESRTLARRVLMQLENATRPWISRLPDRAQTAALVPFVPLYLTHQALRKWRSPSDGEVLYGVREAMHAARDRFAPRYIHRHTEDEMRAWFHGAGYEEIRAGSERQHPAGIPEAFWACSGVDARRA